MLFCNKICILYLQKGWRTWFMLYLRHTKFSITIWIFLINLLLCFKWKGWPAERPLAPPGPYTGTKYILNNWNIHFNPVKASLMAFAILFKILLTHCEIPYNSVFTCKMVSYGSLCLTFGWNEDRWHLEILLGVAMIILLGL